MKNRKVSVKLGIGFFVVVVLTVVVGVMGIVGMRLMDRAASDMYDYNLTPIKAMGDLREAFMGQRNDLRDIFLSQDDEERVAQLIQKVKDNDVQVQGYFAVYDAAIQDEEAEQPYFEARDVWNGAFADMKSQLFEQLEAGDFEAGYQTFVDGAAACITPIVNGFAQSAESNALWAAETDQYTTDLNRRLLIALIAVIAFAIVVAVLLAVHIARLISKPLNDMMGYIKQAGETGNLAFRDDEWANCDRLSQMKDELGMTMKAFTQMMRKFVYYGETVTQVADRDLTVKVEKLGANDTFGNAIENMVDSLNEMFGEIQKSTGQVSTGSKEIADGAQILAQGSTEQAASVQQLSASITDVSEKTKDNAGMAGKAARLAGTIQGDAEKGSAQMNEMMAAVKEIDEAGKSISKVIKAIDDIAFQTNILALNAAVEAARAGEHGKGFAVVAEEVRSLASKSAEAARETGEMIQNSIEKAELGTRIAEETASSLTSIVTGIHENNQIVADIAKSSDEQSMAISQINVGIDQVAQVIQQNSATAEESAAISEEMSAQASVLEDLVGKFKLRGNDGMMARVKVAPAGMQSQMAISGPSPFSQMGGKY